MEQIVYLDNSATTKPCKRAIKYITDSLENEWGNPSSLHKMGVSAESKLTLARETVADFLHTRSDEIFFTGSGTEANNTAVFGAAKHGAKRGKRIVTTSIEHPSVLEPMKRLEEKGFEIIRLSPDKNGVVTVEKLEEAITSDTILVSMMLVNNETGAIQPVEEIRRIVNEKGSPALIHCDAVQAFGKLVITPQKLGVDLLSASGHKIHGPKGIGFLYIRKGVHIPPFIVGGGQEKGFRSGTEPLPLICGLQGAVEALRPPEEQLEKQKQLWLYAKDKLLSTGVVTVNSSDDCLPYILNISVLGYRSETILHFLEARGIFVSSGSACAKGKGSYVLNETGLDRNRVDSALRISFSRFSTADEVDMLAAALTDAAKTLRKA